VGSRIDSKRKTPSASSSSDISPPSLNDRKHSFSEKSGFDSLTAQRDEKSKYGFDAIGSARGPHPAVPALSPGPNFAVLETSSLMDAVDQLSLMSGKTNDLQLKKVVQISLMSGKTNDLQLKKVVQNFVSKWERKIDCSMETGLVDVKEIRDLAKDIILTASKLAQSEIEASFQPRLGDEKRKAKQESAKAASRTKLAAEQVLRQVVKPLKYFQMGKTLHVQKEEVACTTGLHDCAVLGVKWPDGTVSVAHVTGSYLISETRKELLEYGKGVDPAYLFVAANHASHSEFSVKSIVDNFREAAFRRPIPMKWVRIDSRFSSDRDLSKLIDLEDF
jgi:hypothetical protein